MKKAEKTSSVKKVPSKITIKEKKVLNRQNGAFKKIRGMRHRIGHTAQAVPRARKKDRPELPETALEFNENLPG